jgi:hypothetical protein
MKNVPVPSMPARRNHRFAALIKDGVHQVVSVVGAVGDDMFGVKADDEVVSLRHVVLLSRSGQQTDRIAECIHRGMELGARPPRDRPSP